MLIIAFIMAWYYDLNFIGQDFIAVYAVKLQILNNK